MANPRQSRGWVLRPVVLAFLLIQACSAMIGPHALAAPAPLTSSAPTITAHRPTASDPSRILVHGEGFTQQGRVYLVVYDDWGIDTGMARWVSTTDGAFDVVVRYPDMNASGLSGRQDSDIRLYAAPPTTDHDTSWVADPSGVMSILCNGSDLVRAYDVMTAIWSAPVEISC